MQIPLLELSLPNSHKIINEEELKDKLLHPICYCYDMGIYRLDALMELSPFPTPKENPSLIVDIKHEGTIKHSASENIEKISLHYHYTKEFENAYDYQNQELRISKVLIKNKISAYYYRNKLLISTNGQDTKNIIRCIKNCIISQITLQNGQKKEDFKKTFLTNPHINIDKFMSYLIEEYEANVKAIYAGNLIQKENKAIVIYGDEADKSPFYNAIKQQGSSLSCITTKMLLNNSSGKHRNILFNKDCGIMVLGAFTEEYAIRQIVECNDIVESFLINGKRN